MASTLTMLVNELDLQFLVQSIFSWPAEVIANGARDFGVPRWKTDYKKLTEREDADLVCVFSPGHLHAEHCISA